jgi:hypothetical protein
MDGNRNVGRTPRVFIGSSSEGRTVAEFIQLNLDRTVESTIWDQGVFGLSKGTLESLTHAVEGFDFAVLVLTPDDLTKKRGRQSNAPRDNVVFELGLFMGALGRNRTFIVHPNDESLDLPSDLAGVTTATFRSRPGGDLQAALGPACTQLKIAIRKLEALPAHAPLSGPVSESKKPFVKRRRRRRSLGSAKLQEPKKAFHIINISVTGAFLETDEPLREGQLLDIDLELENDTTAKVSGKVVRIQLPSWGKTGGAGLEFTNLTPQSKKIIEEYVEVDQGAG